MLRPVYLLIFKLWGWKIIDQRPKDLGACIYVVAPHTSNWDFLVGLCVRSIARLGNVRYLAKKQLFVPPFGWFFRALGGVPVDRSRSTNLTDQVVGYFRTIPGFAIAITPEGTRRHVAQWKTGFWRIAHDARVPLILSSFDFSRKEVILRAPYQVSDNVEADIAWMMDYFRQFKGRNAAQGVR